MADTPNDLISDNIAKLKTLFPHVVSEGGVDFDALQQALGKTIDTEHNYTFTWHGKRKAERLAYSPSWATLLPCENESKNWDSTENILIEGDNLEVLKCLQKSYANKIKMIYIDPPYNTGSDFVYNDDFTDNLENYLIQTGQKTADGKKTHAKSETAGRKHTKWLNMIYPRLLLARNLLREDGVIFISIDDNEQANLKKVCDEVFGEENFIACFTWTKKEKASGVPPKNMSLPNKEYILTYGKNINIKFKGQKRSLKSYKQDKNGRYWRTMPIQATGKQNSFYTIVDPKTNKEYYGNWAFKEETILQMIYDNKIVFPENAGRPQQIVYADTLGNSPIFHHLGFFDSEVSTKKVIKLFNNTKVFDFPKPIDLINFLVEQSTTQNDIILDFFAGSGTTAHAVMDLNAQDGGQRRCISVQLPELTDEKSEAFKAGYTNIAEITKERIRRAGDKILADNKDLTNLDIGFKVFKLHESNIKQWRANFDTIATDLFNNVDNMLANRTDMDKVTEIALKYGLYLHTPIVHHTTHHTPYYTVQGNDGIYKLFVFLHPNSPTNVTDIILNENSENYQNIKVVFADSCFDNADKATVYHTLIDVGVDGISFL